MENWKDIQGFEGLYRVSDEGNVYSVKLERNLGQKKLKGYRYVSLNDGAKRKDYAVHRLVAQAWVGKLHQDNKVVKHRDGNLENNRADNLVWVSESEKGETYSAPMRRVRLVHKQTGQSYEFENVYAAAKALHVYANILKGMLNGKDSFSNYRAEYVD